LSGTYHKLSGTWKVLIEFLYYTHKKKLEGQDARAAPAALAPIGPIDMMKLNSADHWPAGPTSTVHHPKLKEA
jgi:hypothetical protein